MSPREKGKDVFRTLASRASRGHAAAWYALSLVSRGKNVQEAVTASIACGDRLFSHAPLSQKERHLCTELTYGYLRSEIRLRTILNAFLRHPEHIPPVMMQILGLGAYALLLQSSAPVHTVVHGTVSCIDALFGQSLARVANAVLRALQRQSTTLQEMPFYHKKKDRSALESLARYYSVPLWIAQHFAESYGETTATALLQRSFARPWLGLRVNACHPHGGALLSQLQNSGGQRIGEWGIAFPPGERPVNGTDHDMMHWHGSGLVSFQAAGSLAVLEALDLFSWDMPVWDVCAGFGGKTLALIERHVPVRLATDISWDRLHLLPKQCQRLGLSTPCLALVDGRKPLFSQWQGHILVDAPCSGLGVLARRPDLRRCPDTVLASHLALQRHLLSACLERLSARRQLAYITCTLNPAENEDMISRAVREHAFVHLVRQWQTPHTHPWLEGMYGALLEKW